MVCPGFFGGGQRHLYLDAAIVDGAGAVASRVGAASSGMTAATREAAKVRKYGPICERIGAEFRAAVIERLGCCGDGLCSVIKLFSGDGDRGFIAAFGHLCKALCGVHIPAFTLQICRAIPAFT